MVVEEIRGAEYCLNWYCMVLNGIELRSCFLFPFPVSPISCSFLRFSTLLPVGQFLSLFSTFSTCSPPSIVMGRRCCVPGCQSNFDKSKAKNPGLKERNDLRNKEREGVTLFGLPSKKKASIERRAWIKSIPGIIEANVEQLKENPAICVKHWPSNYLTVKTGNGGERPAEPPSIFEGFHPSEIPGPAPPLPPPRPTKKTSFEVRTFQPDELKQFQETDLFTFEELKSTIKSREFSTPTISFAVGAVKCGYSRSITFQEYHCIH